MRLLPSGVLLAGLLLAPVAELVEAFYANRTGGSNEHLRGGGAQRRGLMLGS